MLLMYITDLHATLHFRGFYCSRSEGFSYWLNRTIFVIRLLSDKTPQR